MNKKKLLTNVLLGVIATSAPVAISGMVACEKPDPYNSSMEGTYYYVANDTRYTVELKEKTFTLETADGTITGVFSFDGSVFVFTAEGDKEVTAKVTDGVLSISVGGKEYTLYKDVYAVDYMIDGKKASTEWVIKDKTPTKPQNPSKEGYVFIGWYADEAYKTEYKFNQPITQATTVYARFVENSLTETEFTVTLMNGSEKVGEIKTINGVAYSLPVLEKENAQFKGWWVSAGSADKLSYKYEEQKFGQNVTLYAVWNTENPYSLTVSDAGANWTSAGAGSSYNAVVYNEAGESVYTFKGTGTNFKYDFTKAPAGQYKVELSVGSKKYSVYYNNKYMDTVCLMEVKEGTLFCFNKVDGAEKYLISVECGDPVHSHVDMELNADTNSYNFKDCEMKADGIKFTVKAVAEGKVTSVSEAYTFEQSLAEVKNFTYNKEQATITWDAVENATEYNVTVSDGKNTYTYERVSGTSVSVDNVTGNVTVSIKPVAHLYNSTASQFDYLTTRLVAPENIKLSGNSVTWDAVEGASGYQVTIFKGEGQSDVYSTDTNSMDITNAADKLEMGKTYDVKVTALSSTEEDSSMYSKNFRLSYAKMNDAPEYGQDTLTWSAVFGASKYGVKVNDGEEIIVENGNSTQVVLTQAGENTLYVRLYDVQGNPSDEWLSTVVNAYSVTFNVANGKAIEPLYKASGDTFTLEGLEAERMGYTFVGWTIDGKTPTGSNVVTGDTEVLANWTANQYKVNLSTEGVVEDVSITDENGNAVSGQTVTFDGDYALPVATTLDTTKVFMGWFTSKNGTGTQCTDEKGNSLRTWAYSEDTTLYPGWGDVFTFNVIDDGKAYSVSAGTEIYRLNEVTVPAMYNGKPVTTLESVAFINCTNLYKINIPDTIKSIELSLKGGNETGSAFQGCTNLTDIVVFSTGARDVKYASYDGALYAVNYDEDTEEISGKTLLYLPVAKTGVFNVSEGTTIIDMYACYKSNVTKITIPSTVTYIGQNAFTSSTKLEEVEFLDGQEENPAKLTFGEMIFQSCTNITKMTLPSRLGEIDVSVFKSCTKLTELAIVGSGDYFSEDGVLCKTENVDGKTVKKLVYVPRARDGEFTIPSGITVVGKHAFGTASNDRVAITKVIIPSWVTELEDESFYYCNMLQELVFEGEASSNDLKIGKKAFYYCSKLTSVVLPANLTYLDEGAFAYTTALTEVTLTTDRTKEQIDYKAGAFANISNAGYYTYYVTKLNIGATVPEFEVAGVFGNEKLVSIVVDENNPNYSSVEGVLFNKTQTTILFFPTSRGGTYQIPETVETIGSGIFANNKNLSTVIIGKGVTLIGQGAFNNCTGLISVQFEEGRESELVIERHAFRSCTGLTSITIPETTVEIQDQAFYGCSKLTEITLPASLRKLGAYVEREVTLSDGTKVQKDILYSMNVFYNCSYLENINVVEGNPIYASRNGILYSKEFVNTDGVEYDTSDETYVKSADNLTVTGIYYQSSDQDGSLKTLLYAPRKNSADNNIVVLPKTLMKIFDNAFYYNGSSSVSDADKYIHEITYEGDIENLNNNELKIGVRAFSYMSSIKKVSLPEGVKTITRGAFRGCYAAEVNLPTTVQYIDALAFAYCSRMERLNFAEGGTAPLEIADCPVSTTGYDDTTKAAFYYCTKLENLVLPERTTKIGTRAFYACTKLKSVTIPTTVRSIGNYAFYTSYSAEASSTTGTLTEVTFVDNLYKAVDTQVVTAPESGVEYYTATEDGYVKAEELTQWAEGTTYYTLSKSALTSIGDYAFYRYLGKTLTLPSSLTTIGANAFSWCPNLESVVLNKTLKNIGEYAFYYCSKLQSVSDEEGIELEKIGNRAFYSCTALTSVQLSNVKEIGENVFYSDKNLKEVTFGEGLTKIGYNAFGTCTALEKITLPSTIEIISKNAFDGCTALTSITFATNSEGLSNLKEIGERAFTKTGLKSFSFPETGALITFSDGKNVFYGCNSLETVYISNSVASVAGLFVACPALSTINVANDHASIAVDNENKIITTPDKKTISMIFGTVEGEISIPEGTEKIESGVYANQSGITAVSLPASLLSIGDNCFSNCPSLSTVTFAANSKLETIGVEAFFNTPVTSYDLPATLKKVDNKAFASASAAKALTSVTFNSTKVAFGTYVFSYQQGLTSVTLPSSQDKIPERMFNYCTTLETVNIPATVTEIATYAFGFCYKFKGSEELTVKEAVMAEDGVTEIEPAVKAWGVDLKNVKTLGNYAFYHCEEMPAVRLTKTTTSYGTYLFQYSGLEYVIFDGVTSLKGNNMFSYCTKLKEVTIPKTITAFGTYLFSNSGLEHVYFDGNTTFSGGNYMFQNCKSLVSVELPATAAAAFGTYMFQNCTALESVTIPEGVTALTTYMFSGCSALKNVTLPSTLKTVGNSAFNGCSSLETVDFTVTEDNSGKKQSAQLTGTYLFQNCTSLKSVTIPGTSKIGTSATNMFVSCTSLENVVIEEGSNTDIPNYMFQKCASLKSIKLPSTIKKIGTYAFSECSSLEKVEFSPLLNADGEPILDTDGNNTWSLTDIGNYAFNATAKLATIELPSSLKTLGTYAFQNSGITSLVVPKLITAIPQNLCFGCSSLKEVTFLGDVKDIGQSAFRNCTSLETANIGNKVETINNYAFDNSGLTAINLPATLTALGTYTFRNNYNLAEVKFNKNDQDTYSITVLPDYCFQNTTSLKSIELPDTLVHLGKYTFQYSGLESIVIPDSIEHLGDANGKAAPENAASTFAYCTNLKEVTLSKNLKDTSHGIFYGCTAIEEIVLPDSMVSLGKSAFWGCTSLKKVTMGDNLKTFWSYVFAECTSLTEINLGANLETIGDNAFQNCSSLQTVTMGNNVKTLGGAAFANCQLLETINLSTSLESIGGSAFQYNYALTKIDLPDSLKTLGDRAFWGSSIEKLVLGSNIQSLGYAALYDMPELSELVLNDGLKVIGGWAISHNPKLTSLTIPDSVEEIGEHAFYYQQFTNFKLPASLKKIGSYSIEGVPVKTLTIPASLETVEDAAFAKMADLESVIFESGSKLQVMGTNMFWDCQKLSSISLPDSITTIDAWAFENTAIETITIPANVSRIDGRAFYNCQSLVNIIVNSNNLSYKEYDGMIYTMDNKVQVCPITKTGEITLPQDGGLMPYAFSGCTGVTKINLPDGMAEIPDNAFYNCTALTSITLPEGIKAIGNTPFEGCPLSEIIIPDSVEYYGSQIVKGTNITSLTLSKNIKTLQADTLDGVKNLVIPDGLTQLPEKMFYNNTTIESVVLPNTITEIPTYCFRGCTSLKEIVIPDSVTTIGTYAFYQSGLKNIVLGNGVKEIGDYAFGYVEAGCTLDLSGVEKIGKSTFQYSEFEEVVVSQSLKEIVGVTSATYSPFYYAQIRVLTFKEGVETVLPYMFCYTTSLEEINLPTTLTTIDKYAFYYAGMTTLDLSNTSVTLIGNSTFQNCKTLRTVILPDTLEKIDNYGLNSTDLRTITIPASVNTIGTAAFTNCYNLVEVVNLSSLDIKAGANTNGNVAFYAKSVLTQPATPETSAIVNIDGILFVADEDGYICVGYQGDKTSIVLPDKVNGKDYKINQYAFYLNSQLESVTLGAGCTEIGNYAFAGLNSTTKNGIKHVTLNEGCTAIGNYAFSYSMLETIDFKEGLVSIGTYAFQYTMLETIDLKEGLVSIGNYAFQYSKLEKVTLPSTIETMGTNLFNHVETLVSADLSKLTIKTLPTYTFAYCYSLSQVKLPETLEELGNYSFSNCTNLMTITLPKSLKTIGSSVFLSCYRLYEVINLSSVTLTTSNVNSYCKNFAQSEKDSVLVNQNGYVFWYDSAASSWMLVGYDGFETELRLPDYVTIGEENYTYGLVAYSFYQNKRITKVLIPDTVTSMSGTYNFNGASNLQVAYVGKGITKLGTYAFYNCTGMQTIYFGNEEDNIDLSGTNVLKNTTAETIFGVSLPEGL